MYENLKLETLKVNKFIIKLYADRKLVSIIILNIKRLYPTSLSEN